MAEQLVDVDVAVNPPTSGSHVIMSRQIIISTFLLLLATQSSKHTGRQKRICREKCKQPPNVGGGSLAFLRFYLLFPSCASLGVKDCISRRLKQTQRPV